jgi:VWFA-related protein
MRLALLLSLSLVISFTTCAHAQSAAPVSPQEPSSDTPIFRTGTSIVLVPALVRTEKGQLVFTLTAKDFLLTDDDVEQKLTLEEDTDSQPLALVIVAETGAAGAHHLDNYSKLGSILDSVVGGVQHKVAVVGFDSVPNEIQEFTPDLDQVAATMNHLQTGDDGDAIYDALAFAVDLLRKQPPDYRRAILLVSESLDHGSHTKLEDTLRAISDTNTTIYSMGFSTTRSEMKYEASQFDDREHPGPAGGCMSRGPKADPDADDDTDADTDADTKGKQQNRAAQAYDCASLLVPPLRAAKMLAIFAVNGMQKNVPETVAQLTGGEFYKFENEKSFERGLITISNNIPNRYVLSFHPQSLQPGLHAIKLQVRDYAKLKVNARSSYWVDGPATGPAKK